MSTCEHLHAEMRLAMLPCIFYPLFQNIVCLLHKLAMEVNGIRINAARRIILSKYELRGLLVIFLHLPAMRLALLGQFFRQPTIAVLVCMPRL